MDNFDPSFNIVTPRQLPKTPKCRVSGIGCWAYRSQAIIGGIASGLPLQRYTGEGGNNMNWKILNRRTRLNLISAIILVVGLGSATLIYQRADNIPYGAWGYESVDGIIYPIMPEDSKMYRHNLEVYGGKLNVMMDDFSRWFGGLWQGKSLAVIIGCATHYYIVLVFLCGALPAA